MAQVIQRREKTLPDFNPLKFSGEFIFACWLVLLVTVSPGWSQEIPKDENVIEINKYQEHRLAFKEKQKALEEKFQYSLSQVDKDIENLKKQINDKDAQLSNLQKRIAETGAIIFGLKTVLAGISFFLFPLASTWSAIPFLLSGNWSVGLALLYLFLPVTAINLYLYLKRREQVFFAKYRIALTVFLILLISVFATPLFADELSKYHEKAELQLDLAVNVLSLSDYQKFIAILEAGVTAEIELPQLASNNELLEIFPKVRVDTVKYYSTLAALYDHENQTGKAVDSISKIFHLHTIPLSDDHDRIIVNSIKFLIQQQQTGLVSTGAEQLANKMGRVARMLELATFLQDNGMQVSAEKVLGVATQRAATVKDLVDLAVFFINNGKGELATEALSKAIGKAQNINDIIYLVEFAVTEKKDKVIEELTKKVTLVAKDFEESLKVVDVFLRHNRKEDAITVFSAMDDQVNRSTKDYSAKLLFLINTALERNLLEQAIKTTSKLSLFLGESSYTYNVPPSFALNSYRGLEDPDKVSLPLFYGLLNEELNFNGKAEISYIRAVLYSLEQILKSYGYESPDTLNAYHLLGRTWIKENRWELIQKLDGVYTSLEDQFLQRRTILYDEQFSGKKMELERLQKISEEKSNEIIALKKDSFKSFVKLIITSVNTGVVVLFLLAILIGCIILAKKYSDSLTEHKMFGFTSKFVELTGWVRIMTIIGAVSGLVTVLFAQLLQIIQKNHENTSSISILISDQNKISNEILTDGETAK